MLPAARHAPSLVRHDGAGMIGEGFAGVLDAAQRGEGWAFACLYRDLNASLLRYFGAQAPSEAEDLASETWLAAARAVRSFTGDERAFRSWFFTIAHRRLIQHWRDTGRRPSQPVAPETLDDMLGLADTERDALQLTEAVVAARSITAALPPDQAHVVLLRIVAGLSVEQVAAVLGKRPGTVRVLQHRGLRKLAGAISLETVTR